MMGCLARLIYEETGMDRPVAPVMQFLMHEGTLHAVILRGDKTFQLIPACNIRFETWTD